MENNKEENNNKTVKHIAENGGEHSVSDIKPPKPKKLPARGKLAPLKSKKTGRSILLAV